MTRNQGLAALAAGFLLITAALTWLLGAWGLLIAGFALVAVVLFAFDQVVEDAGEAVADAPSGPKHRPVQPGPVRR